MLEQRRNRRRRVCLAGAVTCGPESAILPVRIKNLSDHGAEIVAADGHIPSRDVEFSVQRADARIRSAKVVWRRMRNFGLEFSDGRDDRGDTDATVRRLLSDLGRFGSTRGD
ncbi:PilZ domain-containing protein [Aurantimonas sp. C2-6-R+9]|uniref:PilZ domain-containing protein n=1 Tax=unclassified Aurantimonas TaxID=2638230 RepID=UPI002E1749FD|nr:MULTISPECIES: PilZ domain-containing protein [unclassified Aurantimonas]MEC5289119.1 PilZ domain-containing protein [Aurantimonas sp. C2-3-R2]MEC5379306.1 PilZ domain-containing protein [Aurantimonas sp. C2-6-R+9]MEC5410059.1 PilZ domain-containing protein [Aurantimonas sp. C2-4-R8]